MLQYSGFQFLLLQVHQRVAGSSLYVVPILLLVQPANVT